MPLSLQTIANIMATCTGNEILQFGNTFAQNVVIGTNDNNAVEIETNNVSKFRVATSGLISVLTANYKTLVASANDIPNKDYVDTQDATKQDTLVSGTNIKTINSASVLGSGDLVVSSAISSGNILYVSPNATNASGASIASDAWTRAQAIGRPDRPFITLSGVDTVANNGDIIRIMSDVAGSQLTKDVTLVGNDRYTTLTGNFTMVNNIPGQRRIVLKNIRTTGTVIFGGLELVMNDCDISFTIISINQGAATSIEAENTIFRNAVGVTTGNQPKFNNCVFKGNVQFDINTTPTPLSTDRAFLQECIFEGNLTLSSNNAGAYMKECIVQGSTTIQVSTTYTKEYKIYNCDLASLSVTGNGTAGVAKLKISNSVYSGTYTNTATNLATTTNNFVNIPV